jgi:hypothetical protein
MSLYVDGTLGISASSGSAVLNNAGNTTVLTVTTVTYADTTSQTTAYVNKAPTQQIFTSGTGTYTLPAGAKWIKIRMVAAGGGGGGGGTSAGTGGTGGATTFGTSFLTCNGGGGGAGSGSGSQGVGGTASGGDINVQGGYTDPILSTGTVGNNNSGRGAASAFGGGGAPGYGYSGGNSAGGGGLAYGCGGGGGGGSAAGSGSGGAGGGYLERLITSPAATYSYAVGTGGTGGTAGTSGSAGGSGGTGVIIVEEHYNY